MEVLPISVVVPHQTSRENFFTQFCRPSIEANRPAQIIVNSGIGNPAARRNSGALEATQPYIFFCDDDIILSRDCLLELLNALESNPDRGYAYCDFHGFTIPGAEAPKPGPVFTMKSRHFDENELRRSNYISSMSLVRRSVFPGFDNSLGKLEDWNLFLTLLARGVTGAYVPKALFFAFYTDAGISVTEDDAYWAREVMKRQNR